MKTDIKNRTTAGKQTSSDEKKEVLFHGVPVSPGIAIAPVRLIGGAFSPLNASVPEERVRKSAGVEAEIKLFQEALSRTFLEIKNLQSRLRHSLAEREAGIFDAHLLIVKDKMLVDEVIELIRKEKLPAESAFRRTISRYIATISGMPDQYLRERVADIKDVAARIINHISGLGIKKLCVLDEPVVIIARDLAPSDTASLDRSKVLGFAIETGSRTSHTAILARSLRIPAVAGMQRIFKRLHDGDRIIIDGYLGMVIIHPEPETVRLYEAKLARKERLYAEFLKESRLRAETTDGFCIQLAANVEGLENEGLEKSGAEGIGLFRTEYLFMNKPVLPDEETQFHVYKTIAEAMPGRPVVIRTLDLGGDKLEGGLTSPHEPNPFLGLRAIRLCLERPELLKAQMRAILRAGIFGDVKMMFPMVSCVDELEKLLALRDEVKTELMNSHQSFKGGMETGVMIEIPSAALIADELAERVDFFSIGSNDLVQYTLAVDRGNERVAHLYNPAHPAVIELIARTAKAAHDHQIWISCCGEIAGDPKFVPLLAGLGIQELSMSPASIAPVRRIIRRLSMRGAELLAQQVLEQRDARVTRSLLLKFLSRIAPDVAKMIKGF